MNPRLVLRLASRVRLVSLLLVAALVWSGWAGTLDLAVRGRAPEYAIVRAAAASPSVKYAAEELRDFTERLTGVRLPIVTDEGPLPPKAIVLGSVRTGTTGVSPVGKRKDGSLFATGKMPVVPVQRARCPLSQR